MYRTLVLVSKIKGAKPERVYDMLMQAELHGAFTKSKCEISDTVGSDFSLGDGWITGKNLALERGKKIVQLWRGKQITGEPWAEGHHSTVTFEFIAKGEDTEILLTHADVPEAVCADLTAGWLKYYFEPMNDFVQASAEKKDHSHVKYTPGQVCWVEIPAKDLERGKKFYTDAFDWTWQQHAPEYALFGYKGSSEKTATRGDMFLHSGPLPNTETVKLHMYWPSVSEGVKLAVKAGATVVKDTFEIGPGIGWNAFLRDTEGNVFAIYSGSSA